MLMIWWLFCLMFIVDSRMFLINGSLDIKCYWIIICTCGWSWMLFVWCSNIGRVSRLKGLGMVGMWSLIISYILMVDILYLPHCIHYHTTLHAMASIYHHHIPQQHLIHIYYSYTLYYYHILYTNLLCILNIMVSWIVVSMFDNIGFRC